MSTDAERIIDLYERHADAWVEARLRESSLYERGWLERFCALVPPGGSVLDVGCGAGEPIAKYVSERGYAVTGIDSSPAMAAKFRVRLPGQQALVSDMRTLSLGRLFHGILAWDSFFHLNHEDQRQMFPIFRAHAAPRSCSRVDLPMAKPLDALKESPCIMPALMLPNIGTCWKTQVLPSSLP